MTSGVLSQRSTRRGVLALAGATAALTTTPALAQQECHVGPPPHAKGPPVFLNYDQAELDAAYSQPDYEPNFKEVIKRYTSDSALTRARLGAPQRIAYGPTDVEKLDIYRTQKPNAPIFIFIHGGAWRAGTASDYAFLADIFVHAGAHCVIPDFVWVQNAGGSLLPIADQVRRAVAWVYKNAKSFGGDAGRIYVGGHSSGGHLAGVLVTTDWQKDFGLPADIIKGGVCLSGMYDLTPVRLSVRGSYIKFDDAMVEALSSQRHIDLLHAPLIVGYGTYETPEFQRQNREFAAAVKAAGKPVQLIVIENYSHLEIPGTLANPYGAIGYPVLQMMKLA